MKKKTVLFLGIIFAIFFVFLLLIQRQRKTSWQMLSPLSSQKTTKKTKPLEKYTFKNLKKREGKKSFINLEKVLENQPTFRSYLFSFQSENRKITGLANIPVKESKYPVVVMLRGYVDQTIYQTGTGTKRAAEFFAENGFITLAPDFLGYGESDMPPDNVWEERFLRPIAVLDLLASIKTLSLADPKKIFLWGHSNGGLIALCVLEISGKNYPTTLWAPVSIFFPYDVLYYTFEFEDKGKALRKSLAEFEKDYDVNKYSFDEYLEWIKAPILVHQGTDDEDVSLNWTNNLVARLKKIEKEVTYYTYPGADHNMKGAWEQVVQRDLELFEKYLK